MENLNSHALKQSNDLDPLMELIGDSKVVLLGEASHGTHEFYTWRTAITKRLIQEKEFSFIAVEGDWPDCFQINRFVKGYHSQHKTIQDLLHTFQRWPTWMWGNWEIAALIEWLSDFNHLQGKEKKIGFYGLDVYSLWESMKVLMTYLGKEDPEAAKAVKKAVKCFEPYQEEGQLYAQLTYSLPNSCKEDVINMLKEIRQKAPSYNTDPEASLNTEQNAVVAVNAEKYYRSMVSFGASSWNVRDTHMMDTLKRLMKYHGHKAKGIVWEHNTHIGDARATNMRHAGMINIGQLARKEFGRENVKLVGFGTYEGSVIAADEWEAPMREMEVPPAIKGSVEQRLHDIEPEDKLIITDFKSDLSDILPHRAIGVVYNPLQETNNYVPSVMAERYDAFLFLDKTTALHPLHLPAKGHKVPETYPFGF